MTAIEKLIEEMESLASTQEYAMPSKAIRDCIYLAYAKLPIEKQQIVDAAADQLLGIMHEEGAKEVGEQYYQNTFKK